MADPRFLAGFVAVALAILIVLAALLLAGTWRAGARRPGLVAFGLPLALVPPVLAAAYAARKLLGLFSGFAESGDGGSMRLLDACASLGALQRLAWGGFVAACALGLLLSLLPASRAEHQGEACSVRRAALLALLPLLGPLVALPVTLGVARALRVTAAVTSSIEDPAGRERTDAVLEAAGFSSSGSGSIGAISRFIARATLVGSFGGATAVVVLLGLALPGLILAWRVRFDGTFRAAASVAWLLAAVMGTVVGFVPR
jgi:hypothetical protein